MSVKSIPKRERGLLDPKAMFLATVTKLEENTEWSNPAGVTACYVGELQIEGIVPDTSTEVFDEWMKKKMRLGFYIPGEEASWFNFACETFTAFAEACEVDQDEFNPEDCVGKTIIIQVKKPKGDGTPQKYKRNDGTVGIQEEREEIAKFYHPSIMD